MFLSIWFLKRKTRNQEGGHWPYLAHFSSQWKNKTTLTSSTLKVGEKKVVSFFHFKLKLPRYCQFLFSRKKYLTTKKENGWGSWTGRRNEARGLKFFVWVKSIKWNGKIPRANHNLKIPFLWTGLLINLLPWHCYL